MRPQNISIGLRNLLMWPFLPVAIGVPINSLVSFATLLVGSLFLLLATPKSSSSRWTAAGSLAIVGAASLLVAPPAIEEGMNAFVPDFPQEAALRLELPEQVYANGLKLYAEAYPLGHHCDPGRLPDFRRLGPTARARFAQPYAFSADGLWSGARYSRQTTSVDFSSVANLRAGFVNDFPYFWFPSCPDLARNRMPFIVRYDLPADYRGSEMCWAGMVMLQDGRGLRDESGSGRQCLTLAFDAGPPVVFGMAARGVDLALKITPPTWLRVWDIGLQAARIGATLLVLLIFFRPRYLTLAMAVVGAIASLIFIDRYEPDRHLYFYPFGQSVDASAASVSAPNFSTYRLLPSDLDGIRYVAFARSILWDAAHGKFKRALEGGEAVYLYMPGMRYLEAATLAVFGDSEFGPVFLAAITAIGLFYFIATFTNAVTALALCVAFLVGPKLLTQPFLLDLDVWLHVYFGHWSDGTAALALMISSATLLRLAQGSIVPTFGALVVPGILVSVAVFLRANYALAGMAVMVCGLWGLRRRLPPSRLVTVAAGFGLLATAALHNWAFSGELVPFTRGVGENLPAGLSIWTQALSDTLVLGGSDAARSRIVNHLALWLNDLTDEQTSPGFVLLRVVTLALLPALALVRRLRTLANVTLLAIILTAQLPLFFFLNTGRYGLVAWPCTLLGAVLVARAAAAGAIDFFRKWKSARAPADARRLRRTANSPASPGKSS
jgi:hypothetical protein